MEEKPTNKKKKKKDKTVDLDFDKEKAKLAMFDPRGVQTLFRTLSRNHYNLLRMIDGKASIVLTVNSIIISLLMGALYVAPVENKDSIAIVARILILFSIASMILSVLSMLPHRYLGKKFKKSGYEGSLYASNFATNSLQEFREEFNRIMENGQAVYNEMINDLYFLGQVIHRKQIMLWFAVVIFLIGLISCFVYIAFTGIMDF